jgi:hypothetical protein
LQERLQPRLVLKGGTAVLKGVIFGGDPGRHPEVAMDLERMPEPDGAMPTDT